MPTASAVRARSPPTSTSSCCSSPPAPDLRYLIGADTATHERLTCLVVPAAGHRAPPALVVPRMEAPGFAHLGLDGLGVEVVTWLDGEDPYLLVSDLAGGPTRIAVADTMPAVHVFGVQDALPDATASLAGPVLRELRMRKDAAEVRELRAAGAAIDRVHARMAEFVKAGRTEAQAGADIAAAIVEEGHAEAAFVIVGSGPNGASPHHDVSDRVIEAGDVVVIDIGGRCRAATTPTPPAPTPVGREPSAEIREAYAVLQHAQEQAVASVRPGVTAEEVDAAARRADHRGRAGGAVHPPHRARHRHRRARGALHRRRQRRPLEPGMAFSVEPGVYLDGEWGARIEDIVVVTADGVERLNHRPRDLVVLD
jgi:Xaa-Pro dipeptidase